jgi:hypothetical protein
MAQMAEKNAQATLVPPIVPTVSATLHSTRQTFESVQSKYPFLGRKLPRREMDSRPATVPSNLLKPGEISRTVTNTASIMSHSVDPDAGDGPASVTTTVVH